MKINGSAMRTIWREGDGARVSIIDQTRLPHEVVTIELSSVVDAAHAIKSMQVRGAPLIGATAAYGLALALTIDASDAAMASAVAHLADQRPTAINLRWALGVVSRGVQGLAVEARADAAFKIAAQICDDDVENCRLIGTHGVRLIRDIAARKHGGVVNILTHCNAGWLACVDWGTATSPIYHAHDAGVAVHVFVDETRPRNQGASLTSFELGHHGVPHTLIVDNAGGHLMQQGMVDLVIVGADRVTAHGDAANKIGTYLKALAAHDCGVPFYVALPSSTIDWSLGDGQTIPIEDRGADEVRYVHGRLDDGTIGRVLITPSETRASNPAFDVTPARLITGLITERGVTPATRLGLLALYPEHLAAAE